MDDSEFAVDATFPDPHLDGITAQGQAAGETADATDWSPTISFTAGQVISTLDDLEVWAPALFAGEGEPDPAAQQLRRDSRSEETTSELQSLKRPSYSVYCLQQ